MASQREMAELKFGLLSDIVVESALFMACRSSSTYRTSIGCLLWFCFAKLQNKRIKTFEPIFATLWSSNFDIY